MGDIVGACGSLFKTKTGELTAGFDLVVGVTPEDPKEDPLRFQNPKYKKG